MIRSVMPTEYLKPFLCQFQIACREIYCSCYGDKETGAYNILWHSAQAASVLELIYRIPFLEFTVQLSVVSL